MSAALPAVPAQRPWGRGKLHLAATPAAIALLVLYILGSTTAAQLAASIVWGTSAIILFAISALYHSRVWGPQTYSVLARVDHANIFVFIASTFTPFGLLALHGPTQQWACGTVWAGCAAGAILRASWLRAPGAIATCLYLLVSAAALVVLPELRTQGGTAVIVLLLSGGALYGVGGVMYGLKKPNPWPRFAGSHELFHLCTVLAFAAHAVAIGLLILR